MDKIKIYKDSYGDTIVKIRVEFILDIYVDGDIKSINENDVIAAMNENDDIDMLLQIERCDLIDQPISMENYSKNFHIITVNDNIKHIQNY